MQKVVVYTLTRNIYRNVIPSLKSLLKNGNVDRVVLVTELADYDVGFDLPDKVITMPVSKHGYFYEDGPNFNCKWTYMALMKTTMPYLFPRHKRILTLDVDTIVLGDLSPLWDLDLDGYYLAGAMEPYWTMEYKRLYVNMGVVMWNLEQLRDGMCNEIINSLNRDKWELAEQACVNAVCRGKILQIGPEWNSGDWTKNLPEGQVKVRHFMAYGQKAFQEQEIVKKYAAMGWDEVFRKK